MLFGIEPLFSPFPSKDIRIKIFKNIVFPRSCVWVLKLFSDVTESTESTSENRFFFSWLDSSNGQRRLHC